MGRDDRTQIDVSRDFPLMMSTGSEANNERAFAHPAAGAEQLFLDGVAQVHAELRAIASVFRSCRRGGAS